MTAHRSTEGLALASGRRRAEARRKIKKALRETTRTGLAINPNAVARHAKVARKTIYNHTDLLEQIRAENTAPRPQLADPAPAGPGAGSSIDTGLRPTTTHAETPIRHRHRRPQSRDQRPPPATRRSPRRNPPPTRLNRGLNKEGFEAFYGEDRTAICATSYDEVDTCLVPLRAAVNSRKVIKLLG